MKIRMSIVGKAGKSQSSFSPSSYSQSGFTYILILMALVVVGILAGATAIPASQKIKRDKEEALLFAGIAYQKAIKSYYEARPSFKQYPRRLDDLLLDSRVVYRRHIRQLYPDPFSDGEWQLIRDKSGGITGVASSSSGVPLKQFGFPYGYESFENAGHYSDWVFDYKPQQKVKK